MFDFFSMTIPNWLNALLMVGFIGLIFAVNLPMVSIGWHLFAAFITLAIGFGAFALNFFGGGDAKSVAAIAAWLGWSLDTALFLLIMAILGGLFAIILLIIRYMNIGKMLPKKVSEINWVKAIVTPEMRMPYGVAIGAAGLVIYTPDKWLML
ncbi:MAG: prepilin peptidase [Rhizobiales bacterium]|nr:prepilin peptidase [Hyphomicrobiales bacterium]NRB14270.1 prepilin peptidase [Hyphomicrobiales bacterium]